MSFKRNKILGNITHALKALFQKRKWGENP